MGGSGGGVLVGAGVEVGKPVGKMTGVGGKGWNGVGVVVESDELTGTGSPSCAATLNCEEEEMGTTVNPGIVQADVLRMIKVRAIRLNNDI